MHTVGTPTKLCIMNDMQYEKVTTVSRQISPLLDLMSDKVYVL